MNLVILDDFLKENISRSGKFLNGTHLSDRFYDGELAYWSDKKGRKLVLTACGQQRSEIDVKRAIEDKVDIDWLYEYKDDELEDRMCIETYDYDSSRCVFKNGDIDERKLEEYTDVWSNNWTEISFVGKTGTKLFTDCGESDNIISIAEFINLSEEEVTTWLDWFENESSDGEEFRN